MKTSLLLSLGLALLLAQPCTAAPFQFEETGNLITGRYWQSATLLQNGKVLIVGGDTIFRAPLASAELYDPASGTWASTGGLIAARGLHTATLLRNGKVLVAGGHQFSTISSAEVYDPPTRTST